MPCILPWHVKKMFPFKKMYEMSVPLENRLCELQYVLDSMQNICPPPVSQKGEIYLYTDLPTSK